MRRTAFVTAGCVVLALAAAAPAAAADADPMIPLPVTTFGDLLAGDRHVYVSDRTSGTVVVRDRLGAPVTTVTGQPGATGLALSADGTTLYVALRQGDAISAIDTTTLTEKARYPTGAQTCPRSVVTDGLRLWFGYGCHDLPSGVGVVDLSGATPVTNAGVVTGLIRPPLVDIAGGRLLTVETDLYPATLRTYDRDGTTVTPGPARRLDSAAWDIDVTDDGQHVLIPTPSPYHHQRHRVVDLSQDGVYGTNHPYPNAVATFGDHVAAGVYAPHDADIRIYHADGRLIRAYELGRTLERSGLSFAPDGALYAVSGFFGEPVHLHVLAEPTRPVTLVTLAAGQAAVDQQFAVHGRLTSSTTVPPGTPVRIRRTGPDGTGTDLGSVVTSADDTFTVSDTVVIRGTYTYTATFDGDAERPPGSGSVTLYVAGLTPRLSITTDAGRYAYLATATVTARLDSPTTSRAVSISATPYALAPRVVSSGDVDVTGARTTTYVLRRFTWFTATFGGDDRYEPRSVTRYVTAGAVVTQSLDGEYAMSGAYHLYRSTANPTLRALVTPYHDLGCQWFQLQRYDGSAGWRTVASEECVLLDGRSRAAWTYGGTRVRGARYRMRSVFMGSPRNARTAGAWRYLKFT